MAKKKLLIDNTNILKQICNLAHLTRGLLVCFSNPDLDLQFRFRVVRSKLNSNAATEFAHVNPAPSLILLNNSYKKCLLDFCAQFGHLKIRIRSKI